MSDLKINNITNRTGDGGPIIAGVSTVATSAFMVMPSGDTAIRGAGSGRGIIWVNNAPSTKTINKIEIATIGNAVDFGDAMVSKAKPGVCASSTRGIFSGGQPGASPYYITDIEYVTISSSGGGNDFGDLNKGRLRSIDARRGAAAGSNDSTRGLIAGGNTPGGFTPNSEEYNGTAWTEGSNLNTSRGSIQSFGLQTAGVCYGGYTGSPAGVNSTEEYDGSSWTSVNNMGNTRSDGMSHGILTAGLGSGGAPSNTALCEEYDGTNWSTGGALNVGRKSGAGTGTQTAALCAGGNPQPGAAGESCEEYLSLIHI